jgi:hypothetical protein
LRQSFSNHRAPFRRLAALLAALAFTGCGRPARPEGRAPVPAAAATPDTASPTDACALIPQADAEALLGGPVAPPTTNADEPAGNAVSQCAYASPTSHRYLTLLVRRSPTTAEAAAAYDRSRSAARALTGSDPLDVSGIGERAYWTGGTFRQLNVLQKNAWLIVSADLGDGRDRLEGAKAVARRALARYWLGLLPRTGDWLRRAPEGAGPQDQTEPVPLARM